MIEHQSSELLLPISIEEAWNFFSDPRNLKTITPPALKLQIQREDSLPHEIYAGLLIEYKVSPFPFITQNWTTEITHVEKEKYFVDEQRFGPYAFWHHQHHFQPVTKGVLIRDLVHYKIPGKIFGTILFSSIVKGKLLTIFNYRNQVLQKLFT